MHDRQAASRLQIVRDSVLQRDEEWRRTFRLGATPMGLREAPLPQREPTLEERWLEREADVCRALASESAQAPRPGSSGRTARRVEQTKSLGNTHEKGER